MKQEEMDDIIAINKSQMPVMKIRNVTTKTKIEIKMDAYDSLQKIVDQLEMCEYESPHGTLISNVAFMKLKVFAKNE